MSASSVNSTSSNNSNNIDEGKSKDKSSNLKNFLKRNLTIGKHLVLQTIGKADQIEYPLQYELQNNVFKTSQVHFKDMRGTAGRLLKHSSTVMEDEQALGDTLLRFSEFMRTQRRDRKIREERDSERLSSSSSSSSSDALGAAESVSENNNSGGNNGGNSSVGEYEEQRRKKRAMKQQREEEAIELTSKFGETLITLTSLRYDLQDAIGAHLLTKLQELDDEGDVCRSFKEQYREVLLRESVKHNALRSAKEKGSLDVVQVGKAEREYEEAKRRSSDMFASMLEEFDFQDEKRDMEYVEALRKTASSYRNYFSLGAELMKNLEKILQQTQRDQLTTVSRPLSLSKTRAENNSSSSSLSSSSSSGQSSAAKAVALIKQGSKSGSDTKIFGVELTKIMERDSEKDHQVPAVVEQMCQFIEKNALSHEGIFRLAGDHEQMMQLKKQIDLGTRAIEFNASNQTDIHNCACMLKMVIREMPTPLLTTGMYNDFLNVSQLATNEEQNSVLESLVLRLPRAHALLLSRLLVLLKQIIAHSEVNKMTASNCSIVFGINILKPEVDNPLLLAKDSASINKTALLLLKHADVLIEIIQNKFANAPLSALAQQDPLPVLPPPSFPAPEQQDPLPVLPPPPMSSPLPIANVPQSPQQQQVIFAQVSAPPSANTVSNSSTIIPPKRSAQLPPTPPPKKLPPLPTKQGVPTRQLPTPAATVPPPVSSNAPKSIVINHEDNPFASAPQPLQTIPRNEARRPASAELEYLLQQPSEMAKNESSDIQK